MGNCLKKESKPPSSPTSKSSPAKLTNPTLPTSEKKLKLRQTIHLTCEKPFFELGLKYKPDQPINEIFKQIKRQQPQINLNHYSLHQSNIEILDHTATFKQLSIQPEDILELRKLKSISEKESENKGVQESGQIVSFVQSSHNEESEIQVEGVVEEMTKEDTTRERRVFLQERMDPKISRISAKNLWKTAVPVEMPPAVRLSNGGISFCTNNTHEFSLSSVKPKEENSESEKEDNLIEHAHPAPCFKDLQGPFFLFRN